MTAADGDGDGIVFEMGSNKKNDAAIADDVWHGRTAPFLARATAAAKETASDIHRVGRDRSAPRGSEEGLTDIRFAIEFASFPPGSWRSGRKAEDYMREREQRFGSFEIWFYCILGGRLCVLVLRLAHELY